MRKAIAKTYCRLCAELKPINDLIDLQSDEKKCQGIIFQLTRFHVTLDLNDNIWPKTVCSECTDSLKRAYDFVAAVDQAQATLNDLVLVNPLQDESDSENENIECETPEISDEFLTPVELKNDIISENKDSNSKSILVSMDNDDCQAKKNGMKLSWKEYTWPCIHCKKRLKNVDELKIHLLHYHSICNAYQCINCETKIYHLDKFIMHVLEHRHYLKYSCYKCYMKFTSVQEVKDHEATHISSDYVCFGCNTNFSSSHEINIHVITFYKDKQARELPVQHNESLICSLCHKSAKSKQGLDRHLLLHTNRVKEHICDICGKGFFRKRPLIAHIVTHSNSRPHQCEFCKYSFKFASQLRYHTTLHFGVKPFTCEVCGRRFRQKKDLSSHSVIHSDAYPYVCSYCDRGFRFKHLLTQHIRTHTGVKPYSCEICQRKFTNWPNYNKHIKHSHGVDKSKRKCTPAGLHALDPVTGEIIYPEIEKKL